MNTLTRLAVDNREILEYLDVEGPPASVEAFARILDKDPSNFRKTLKALEREGWIAMRKPPQPPVELTDGGKSALQGLAVAEGRLRAGLPTLTHAQIIPDPDQPRRDFESPDAQRELAELADSIGEREILQPLLLRLTGPGAAVIVAGERRWRAVGLLIAANDPRWPPSKPLPYHVSSETDEAEILVDQVVENLQRKGLHALEEAAAFQLLKAKGWGVGAIAKATSKTRRFVELRLDLLTLPQDLQDRMRLPKDDAQHLTATRARELATHLRQLAAGGSDQRDIEELAPTGAADPEEIEAARTVELEPKAMLALGEIAHAIAARPSTRFPHSPAPVVDVQAQAALQSPAMGQLQAAKLATLLLNSDQDPPAAGVRLEALGHVRLRDRGLHPADNPRALFNLRRDAGMSADQARQVERSSLYAAAWLNPPTPTPTIQPAPPAQPEPAEELINPEGADGDRPTIPQIATMQLTPGRTLTCGRAGISLTVGQNYALAELAHKAATDKARPAAAIEDCAWISPDAGKDRDFAILWRNGHIAWGCSLGGRPFARLSPFGKERAAAAAFPTAYVESLGYRTPWLGEASAAPAEQPTAPELNEPQIRALREIAHKLAADSIPGRPRAVRVPGRYWLDLDAVGLWQTFELVTFEQPDPAMGWLCIVTDKGERALAQLAKDYDPLGLEMRIQRHDGRYDTAWLNPIDDDDADDQVADAIAPSEAPTCDQMAAQVAAAVDAGAVDFAQLLQIVGLQGPFQVDAGLNVVDADGNLAAAVDPWASQPEGVAQARAQLLACALNQAAAAAPAAPSSAALLEICAGDVISKGGAMTWRILEAIAKPGGKAHAFRAQPILNGKDHGKPTTVSLADIQSFVAPKEAR